MQVKYIRLEYNISFETAPIWGNPPSFVFRSVLGMNLRRLTCVLRQQKTCSDCMVNDTCVYSCFFETNVDKNLNSLVGVDRSVHPFVIDFSNISDDKAILSITFIGRARNYIPYINLALENAGENGVGKNRARFSIEKILVGDREFSPDLEIIEKESHTWPSGNNKAIHSILLETPCRIKDGGKYISSLNLDILLKNMQRRVSALEEVFGLGEEYPSLPYISTESEAVGQKWIEKSYYSSRQRTVMKLGGVVGEIKIKGPIDNSILPYIEAMEIFHVGKNISFGFGKVKVVN